jgi:uncharacterized protein
MSAIAATAQAGTPAAARPWKRWLVFSPLARIVIFIALFALFNFTLDSALTAAGWLGRTASGTSKYFAIFAMQTVPALAAYLLLVRFIERRPVKELALRRIVPGGAGGFIAGFALITAVVAVLWAAGSYQVTGTNADPHWVRQFALGGLGAAIVEEILTRGVLFRISEEGLGTWGALVVSALFFGLGHIGNHGATVWSAIAVGIEAGLLLGMLFHVSRSLPLCIGVHLGWNFTQGTVWGIPVSGGSDTGWLVSIRSGPAWLSGGIFGAEASVVAVLLCSLCTLALVVLALRSRTIVPPWFQRSPAGQAIAHGAAVTSARAPC